jgi:hypothetical protein
MGIGNRQRAIPPRVFTDPEMLALPLPVRWTSIGLRHHADDQGREIAHPTLLWSSIWPLSTEVTEEDVILHLLALDDVGEIQLYMAGGRDYFQVIDWPKVDHANPSKLPSPPPRENASRTIRETARETFAGGEGERAESESAASRTNLDLGPPIGCDEHPNNTTTEKCGPCGVARLQHTLWERRRAAEAREEYLRGSA